MFIAVWLLSSADVWKREKGMYDDFSDAKQVFIVHFVILNLLEIHVFVFCVKSMEAFS
mgnify:CR=1 FL=1